MTPSPSPSQAQRPRAATAGDADAIAAVFSPSFRLLNFLSEQHSVEEDRWEGETEHG